MIPGLTVRRSSKTLLAVGCGLLVIAAPVLLYMVYSWSRLPSRSELISMYSGVHPTRAVTDVYPGEGDSDAAFYHIHYEDRATSRTGEDVWLVEFGYGKLTVINMDAGLMSISGTRATVPTPCLPSIPGGLSD